MLFKKINAALLFVLLLTLFLTACGGEEHANHTAVVQPTTQAANVPATTLPPTVAATTSSAPLTNTATLTNTVAVSGTAQSGTPVVRPTTQPLSGTVTASSSVSSTIQPGTPGQPLSGTVTAGSPSAIPPTATPSVLAGTPVPASTAGVPPSPTPAGSIDPEAQTLNLAAADPNTFDPALTADVGTAFILRQIYSGLVTLDKNLLVVPDLAAEMPLLTENGTLYTFKLRPGAKFHSGREITAEDFKFTLERATDPKLAAPEAATTLPANTYMNDIVGVKEKLEGKATEISGLHVLDKYTLQIKLDGPKPQFLAKMTYPVFYVVNKDVIGKGFEQLDGSGPFKLAEYKSQQLLRLTRNPDYYLGAPRLSKVNIALGANANNGMVLYEQGKIDITNLSGATVERALDKNSPLNRELTVKSQLAVNYVAFNTKLKPFDDPKVRQAFSLVVDRPRIARALFENKVQPALSLLPPGLPGYSGKPGPLGYDVSRARDLLNRSSYAGAQNLPRITLHTTGDGLARVLQDVYRQAFGVEIEVRQYDYTGFQSGLAGKQFQMYTYGWVADYPDPDNFLRSLLGSGSAFNDTAYSNGAFDEMLKQADQQGVSQRRLELYGDAEQLALADAPLLPVYHEIAYTLVKPYIKGLELTQAGIWSLKDVYILK